LISSFARFINIGHVFSLNIDRFAGNTAAALEELISGKHAFSETLRNAKRPLIVVGSAALQLAHNDAVMPLCSKLASALKVDDNWNVLNVLHRNASQVGALDLGYRSVPAQPDQAKLVYLLNADESAVAAAKGAFIVYQGHHGDRGAHAADVILPGAAYTEKDATYVNTGTLQQGIACAIIWLILAVCSFSHCHITYQRVALRAHAAQ
jgi:NADH-quinone oxidoreductase subunit G